MTKEKRYYGLSVAEDIESLLDAAWDKIKAECMSTGCGSTEYIFPSKKKRDEAVELLADSCLQLSETSSRIAKELEKMAVELRKGAYNFDNEEES